MDFGNFTNNQYYEYEGQPNVEPNYGNSDQTDEEIQAANLLEQALLEEEPVDANNLLPNGTHLCIKSGTYAEMLVNKNDFLPKELLWCYDTKQL
jgi:hypothetical protein